MNLILVIILLILANEAITFLIFFAGPLQKIRKWLIKITPFFYNEEKQTHLLECKLCTSVWVSFFVTPLYWFINNPIVLYFILSMVIFRLSNHVHLIFSLLRDFQIDIRVKRRN